MRAADEDARARQNLARLPLGETDELSFLHQKYVWRGSTVEGLAKAARRGLPERYGRIDLTAVVRTPARDCHLRLVEPAPSIRARDQS